ncbi:MAG: lysophospholipase [Cyclobacteriaceae bacterium]|nr:lysophospholipase [Cyclobacteriaceae bacterium HetDA_MAG_MS6]
MEYEELELSGKDGVRLHTRFWTVENPIGVVCLIHGFGEHIGRYHHVVAHFKNHRWSVFGVDLRGHGLSEGSKGHAPSYDILLEDIEELIKCARAEYTDLPIVLLGHSLGGNLVLNYTISRNVNELTGFVASSPWLKLAFEPPAWKVKLGAIAAKILPSLKQPNGLNAIHLSKDPEVVKAYQTDPLVNYKISAGLFDMITQKGHYAINNADKIKLPGLVYHGSSDQIISIEGTKSLVEKVGKHIDWVEWENVYHEPHNDIEQEQILKSITDWLDKLV